ncbi:MAG: PASTA domain-containing protein, partial [Ruminiclostridium sp.]
GITSILIIAISIAIAISLLTKGDDVPTYKMDNYVGKLYDDVKMELKAKGFENIKITPKDNDTFPKGTITEQSILPETEYKGGAFTPLELTISNGPQMVFVPDVKNQEYREAENMIESALLKVKQPLEKEFNADIPENYVIRTEPAAQEQVKAGTDVVIYVSKGTERKKTKVPYLVGKTDIEVQKLLSDAKLKLGTILPPGTTKGIVNKQLPNADEEVDEGESVTIWLTPQEETVPPADTTGGATEPGTQTDGTTGGTNPPATSTVPVTTSTETPVIP